MKYRGNIVEGTFLSRPNRFIAFVKIGDKEEKCHVKNTGRCKELLVPGCKVYLEESDNPNRSTRFDLIATEKKEGDRILLINMDSQAPNRVVEEWLEKGELFGKKAAIKREVCFVESRFDFSITEEDGRVSFLEVKGCTLDIDGVGYFPDAPTERGVKHLRELAAACVQGYKCLIAFVIQMEEISEVRPNTAIHPEFGIALQEAKDAGVEVLSLKCHVGMDRLEIIGENEP